MPSIRALFVFSLVPLVSFCSPLGQSKAAPVQKRAPTDWVHPGVLVDANQLNFVKQQVAAKADPWYTAYNAMLNDDLVTSTTEPSPVPTVACGSKSQNPDIGCKQERGDALVAYANALAFWISGEQSYADTAIKFMNAWAQTLKAHASVESGSTNTPLQTGWSGAPWSRAAEIIAHSNAGWSDGDVAAFKGMLQNLYLPIVVEGSTSNGNWELVMCEAAIGIAVFLEDGASYDKAMALYMARVPAYIYLLSDGPLPHAGRNIDSSAAAIQKYWYGQTSFQANGITQETCRDLAHTGYGISSISHVAETSRIQGTDLYTGDVGTRLQYALGLQSGFASSSVAVPSWLCGGSLNQVSDFGPVTEVGYNALAGRLNRTMPDTEKYTFAQRPAGTDKLFVGWETLTHAENNA